MAPPFCIIGTPRSRTAWFAQFLTHGATLCMHEPSKHWSRDADLWAFFRRPNIGAGDSMLTLKWRTLRDAGVQMIAVVRPRDAILASALSAGFPPESFSLIDRLCAVLDELPDDVPRYEFDALTAEACETIFERCTGNACPPPWLRHWMPTKVEADFAATLETVKANARGLASLYGPHIDRRI